MNQDAPNPDTNAEATQAQNQLHPGLQFLLDNAKPVLAGVLAILLLVAAYSGYSYYSQNQLNQARETLASLTLEKEGKELVSALQAFASDAPDELKSAAWLETARAAMAAGDHDAAVAAWVRLAESDDDSMKVLGMLGKAQAELDNDNPEAATATLTDLRSGVQENYEPLVIRQLALAAEAAGQWDLAVTAYTELLEHDSMLDRQFLEYKIARIQKEKGATSDNAS